MSAAAGAGAEIITFGCRLNAYTCRQVIWDLAPDIDIYLATPAGSVEIWKPEDLLPDPFGPSLLTARRDETP